MPAVPAVVLNGRLDVLASNALGRALFPLLDATDDQLNNARIVFLDPQSTSFFREWDKVANDTVALLRAEAGREAHDNRGHPHRGCAAAPHQPCRVTVRMNVTARLAA